MTAQNPLKRPADTSKMSCSHITSAYVRRPPAGAAVHKDECTMCFDTPDLPYGVDVCLSCFNSGSRDPQTEHTRFHYQLTSHPVVLSIRKRLRPDRPAPKITKLEIRAESEEDKYETVTQVHCLACDTDVEIPSSGLLADAVNGVLAADSYTDKQEVQAWAAEVRPCDHSVSVEPAAPPEAEGGGPRRIGKQCNDCDLTGNLWLCLTCGNLGCGRAQFGGVGGNSHGLSHFNATGHPVSVKLGSLSPDGTADTFCYVCNDEVLDPNIAAHLRAFGIDIGTAEKTEKSVTEMNIDQNLQWSFALEEDGKHLTPVFGPGLTGLKNLGNSCYMAAVLQCLAADSAFCAAFYRPDSAEWPLVADPAEDLHVQLQKIAFGLLSGKYSVPDPEAEQNKPNSGSESSGKSETPVYQRGIRPAMLKHLLGKDHPEFSTMRQQDAFEFLLHLFSKIDALCRKKKLDNPIDSFRFAFEERLECNSCHKVRYASVTSDSVSLAVPARLKHDGGYEEVSLADCLALFCASETVSYTCSNCGNAETATTQTRFRTLPKTLIVNARKFAIVDWVPQKLEIPVTIPEDSLTFDALMAHGPQPGEELMEETGTEDGTEGGTEAAFVPNAEAMQQLQDMGFPEPRCARALFNTGNSSAEDAANWLFAHMDDADLDEPVVVGKAGKAGQAGKPRVSEESLESLMAMGFSRNQAYKALRESGGSAEAAVEWLFSHPDDVGVSPEEDAEAEAEAEAESSRTEHKEYGTAEVPARYRLKSIVCHKGAGVHTGHYVAFVKKQLDDGAEQWVLFNDEKVVVSGEGEEMKKHAYIYVLERVEEEEGGEK